MRSNAASVPGFLPSTSGFRFPNRFPKVPVRRIGIPGVVSIPIGDASNGLCGGMALAARDYFEAGRNPPEDAGPPKEGSPLFRYLVDRLFDSFDLPTGPARYMELMSPAITDGDGALTRLGVAPRGRGWRNIAQEWPKIRADIDAGHPSPLGLVRVKSWSPLDLKENHQVLAYAYRMSGDRVTIRLYDPNRPRDDGVSLSLRVTEPQRASPIACVGTGPPVHAFFRVAYGKKTPPQ